MLWNLGKGRRENKKPKTHAKSSLFYSENFTFCKYRNAKEFPAKGSFNLKQNDLWAFQNSLELFYHNAEEVKPNYVDLNKKLKKGKLCLLQIVSYIISF